MDSAAAISSNPVTPTVTVEATSSAETSVENPWLGLRAFSENVREYFFGRDVELAELFQRVGALPLTVFYGRSGLGKTSLLQAGLIPKLRTSGAYPVLIRLLHSPNDLDPEQQVLRALASAGAPAMRDAVSALSDSKDRLSCRLFEDRPLWRLFHDPSLGLLSRLAPRVVILFDQFEEIFTLGNVPERRSVSQSFLQKLAELVENRVPDAIRQRLAEAEEDSELSRIADQLEYRQVARIVLAMREDYVHFLDRYRHEMPSAKENRFELRPLTGKQAVAAVYEPGRLRVRNGKPELVSKETSEAIVRYVAKVPSETPIADIEAVPPLLSLFCSELNKKRLLAGKEQIKREDLDEQADNILEDFPKSCYGELSSPEYAEFAQRFVEEEFVSPEEHRQIVNRDRFVHYLANLGLVEAAAVRVINELILARLIVSNEQGGVNRLELTHDILTKPIMRSRIRRRENEKTEALRLEAERRTSEAEGRRRIRRRLWAFALGIGFVALLCGTALEVMALRSRDKLQLAFRAREAKAAQKNQEHLVTSLLAASDRSVTFSSIQGLTSALRSAGTARTTARFRDVTTFLLDVILRSGWPSLLSEFPGTVPVSFMFTSPSGAICVVHRVDNTASLYAADGKWIGNLTFESSPNWFDFSADEGRLMVASKTVVQVWDVRQTKLLATISSKSDIASADLSPNGQFVEFATKSDLQSWRVDTKELRRTVQLQDGMGVRTIIAGDNMLPVAVAVALGIFYHLALGSVSPSIEKNLQRAEILTDSFDSRWLALALGSDLKLLDLQTGRVTSARLAEKDKAKKAAFSATNNSVAVLTEAGLIYVWSLPDLAPRGAPIPLQRGVKRIWLDAEGSSVVAAREDGVLNSFRTDDGTALFQDFGEKGLQAAGSNERIYTADRYGNVRIWGTKPARSTPLRLDTKIRALVPLSFAVRDGVTEATALNINQTSLFRWRALDGSAIGDPVDIDSATDNKTWWASVLSGRGLPLDSQISNVGDWVMTAHEGRVRLGFVNGREGVDLVHDEDGEIRAIAQSADGRMVASASAKGVLRIWRMPEAAVVLRADSKGPVSDLQIDRAHNQLIVLSEDTSISSWDLTSGSPGRELIKSSGVFKLRTCSEGTTLAGSSGVSVRLWSIAKDEAREATTVALSGTVSDMALSPDCNRLATVASGEVQLWDTRTGLPLGLPMRSLYDVDTVVFSPDGMRILCGGDLGPLEWDTPTGSVEDADLVADLALAMWGGAGYRKA